MPISHIDDITVLTAARDLVLGPELKYGTSDVGVYLVMYLRGKLSKEDTLIELQALKATVPTIGETQ